MKETGRKRVGPRFRATIGAGALAALFSATSALADSACRGGANSDTLDFWIGRWEVYITSDGEERLAGRNRIEFALKACAVFEHWTGGGGSEGKSLFYYDARNDSWTQVWVTEDTGRPGGLKIKKLIERFEDGGARFQGEIVGADGKGYLDRTTLTPLGDGTVRQLIEISRDGGGSWQTTFDAVYRRAEK